MSNNRATMDKADNLDLRISATIFERKNVEENLNLGYTCKK